jgi:CubicO group peptidase (beta-lactamase class C family)
MSSILPLVNPEEIGLSQARLGRIRTAMEKHISAGRLAGGLGLIARRGKIGYFETWGMADREAGKAMHQDAIFRIYSMTKAVTGVAAMMLFEEGRFALADPISRFLPEFRDMKVAVEAPNPATGKMVLTGTVPAERQITVLDLMRHTSGINYAGPHDEAGEPIYPQRGLAMFASGLDGPGFITKLSEIPLVSQPGTAWDYGFSTDVLGRLVEVISGQTLAEFFSERILQPLQMVDTGFHVPEAKCDRLVPIYLPRADGTIVRMTGPMQDGFREKPIIFLGGAGLTSTALDYVRFVQMLLNGGELDGVRLLSPMTVELMRSDVLGELPALGTLLAPGHGFGLTFAINKGPGRTATLPAAGQYRWGGAAGTSFWIDPREQMVGVFMMQTMLDLTKRNEFMQLAYQAIVD